MNEASNELTGADHAWDHPGATDALALCMGDPTARWIAADVLRLRNQPEHEAYACTHQTATRWHQMTKPDLLSFWSTSLSVELPELAKEADPQASARILGAAPWKVLQRANHPELWGTSLEPEAVAETRPTAPARPDPVGREGTRPWGRGLGPAPASRIATRPTASNTWTSPSTGMDGRTDAPDRPYPRLDEPDKAA